MSSSSNELTANKVIWWWSWGYKQFDTQFSKTSKHYWSWLRSTHEELLKGTITKKLFSGRNGRKLLYYTLSDQFLSGSLSDHSMTVHKHNKVCLSRRKKNIHYCNKPIGIHIIVLNNVPEMFFMFGWKSSFWVLCQIKHFYILSLSFEDEIADCCGHLQKVGTCSKQLTYSLQSNIWMNYCLALSR